MKIQDIAKLSTDDEIVAAGLEYLAGDEAPEHYLAWLQKGINTCQEMATELRVKAHAECDRIDDLNQFDADGDPIYGEDDTQVREWQWMASQLERRASVRIALQQHIAH